MSQHAKWHPDNIPQSVKELVTGQPVFIDITTASVAAQEMEIPHGLGRIPKGFNLVKFPYNLGVYGAGPTAWTDKYIYLRFLDTSAEYRICVY